MSWGNSYRFIVLVVGFFCLTSVCSNNAIINFTFICMENDMSETRVLNGTVISAYDYTSDEKKYIIWAVGAGTVLGTLPTNSLVVKYGAKIPFLLAGLVSLTSTALIPFAAKTSYPFLLLLRFLQGLAYSTDFAAIGIMTIRWAPLKETALFIATLTSCTGVSSMITNSASGLVCMSSLGWEYAFYFHSIAGLFLFSLWAWLYVDDPGETKRISGKELSRIHKNKSAAHLERNGDVPYVKIFTSPVILVVWLNAFFEMSTIIFMANYMPIYFRQVLEYSVTETGFYAAGVLGFNIPIRLVAASLSDRITILSERWKMIVFNSLALGVSGILMSTVAWIPLAQRAKTFAVILSVMFFIAFNSGGFYKCATLYARQHAHVVIAAIQFTKCLALFFGPTLVGIFVAEEETRAEWIPVFMTLGACMFAANLLAVGMFTAEAAEWTEAEKEYKEVPTTESQC